MCAIATRLDIASITLLVAEPGAHAGAAAMIPFDLDEGTAQAAAALADFAADEHLETADLILAGIEFSDPEQWNTTVTLTGADLMSSIFADASGSRIPSDEVLVRIAELDQVTVPVVG